MATRHKAPRWSEVAAVSCGCERLACARYRARVEAARAAIIAAQEEFWPGWEEAVAAPFRKAKRDERMAA